MNYSELTAGDQHIEKVIKEILAGQPGRPAEIRLLCASDFAQILDKSHPREKE